MRRIIEISHVIYCLLQAICVNRSLNLNHHKTIGIKLTTCKIDNNSWFIRYVTALVLKCQKTGNGVSVEGCIGIISWLSNGFEAI